MKILFGGDVVGSRGCAFASQSVRRIKQDEKIDAMIAENNRKGNVTAEQKREMFAEVLAFFGGRLSRIVSGGAPLDMDSYRGFYDLGITVLNGYGITECAPVLAE